MKGLQRRECKGSHRQSGTENKTDPAQQTVMRTKRGSGNFLHAGDRAYRLFRGRPFRKGVASVEGTIFIAPALATRSDPNHVCRKVLGEGAGKIPTRGFN